MAGSPQFNVYDSKGVCQVLCKDALLAGAVITVLGEGSTIRIGHSFVVWKEGKEDIPASEPYNQMAAMVNARVTARRTDNKAEMERLAQGFRNSAARRY